MTKVLDGQGATPERLQHNSVKNEVRGITRGGMPIAYGQRVVDHCALDILLEKGMIEQDHYDAGMNLRALYFIFTKSGKSCLDQKEPSYEGDIETPQDRAYERHKRAVQSLGCIGGTINAICCEMENFPAMYWSLDVAHGFNDLVSYFKKKAK